MAIESAPECRLATFELHPRPPYRLDLTVWALRRRARNEIDLWDGSYRRALLIDDGVVGIRVVQVGDPERPVLVVEVLGSGACTTAELVDVETQARRLLGVDVDLDEFYSLADADPRTRAEGPLPRPAPPSIPQSVRSVGERCGEPAALPRGRIDTAQSSHRGIRYRCARTPR